VKRSSLPKIIVIALVITCLFATVLSGCQSQPSGEIAVRVIVTQNFGEEVMLDEFVTVTSGFSAMAALERVAEVEHKGGFVEAINGVRSQYEGMTKVKKDWFFYINGFSANIGALDYKLCDGDIEHWDFHDWSFHDFVPAVIGDFPEPFLCGYQGKVLPTIVVYDEGLQDAAQDLMIELKELGVENISAQAATGLSPEDKKRSNLILLGTKDFDLISQLNEDYDKLGLYIHFEGGNAVVFDSRGDKTQYKSSCGVIQATQNLWNPKGIGACENVVWMVSGTDEIAVRDSLTALTQRCDELRYACAIMVLGGEVIKVP
jgi:hypothetical protein